MHFFLSSILISILGVKQASDCLLSSSGLGMWQAAVEIEYAQLEFVRWLCRLTIGSVRNGPL